MVHVSPFLANLLKFSFLYQALKDKDERSRDQSDAKLFRQHDAERSGLLDVNLLVQDPVHQVSPDCTKPGRKMRCDDKAIYRLIFRDVVKARVISSAFFMSIFTTDVEK